jgi:hypothetical protein
MVSGAGTLPLPHVITQLAPAEEAVIPPLLLLLRFQELSAQLGLDSSPQDLWSPTVFTHSLCSPLERPHDSGRPARVGGPVAGSEEEKAAKAIAEEILQRDSTTLMIRNLPNKLTPPMIMECVDELGFENEYDYLFVPIDTNAPGWANRNLGYCFLNLASPAIAKRFCEVAYGFSFRQAVSSTKTSKISIAEEQGVMRNLQRIDRAGPRKEQRGGKHCSQPYVRVQGRMEAMSPSSAITLLGPYSEQQSLS